MARGSRISRVTAGTEYNSSFLSCEKDAEAIIRKLFVDSGARSEYLKRLLIINTKDCLDVNPQYDKIVRAKSLKNLRDERYIVLEPKIPFGENEEIKSRIHLVFDHFTPNSHNGYFRDCVVEIDILCHPECWDIGNYRIRPLKIAGFIDGILNGAHLSGIGTLDFMGCNEIVLGNNLAGYCLMYSAIHGNDDIIEKNEND